MLRKLCLLIVVFAYLPLYSQAANIKIPPPKVNAAGFILVDFDSGNVLAEKNADKKLEPASLTKIMTAYVVFREIKEGNLKLTDETTVSKKAWKTEGSRMFIQVGTRVPVEKLLKGFMIQSGNDAGVALAEMIAGTEETFAQLMNAHAKRLGMNSTNWANSTGLPDPNHFTTARDLTKVTRAVIREFPEFYQWYSIKSYKYNNIEQKNRNGLLYRDPSADGVKTGYTKAAGYCLVGSAKRDDTRLVSVVMGTKSPSARTKASQALLNYGFSFFESIKLYSANQIITKPRIYKGEKKELPVGVAQDLLVSVAKRQKKNLNTELKVNKQITAPVKKGQQVGSITVTVNNKAVRTLPLVALEEIKEAGFIGSMSDTVMMWIGL